MRQSHANRFVVLKFVAVDDFGDLVPASEGNRKTVPAAPGRIHADDQRCIGIVHHALAGTQDQGRLDKHAFDIGRCKGFRDVDRVF